MKRLVVALSCLASPALAGHSGGGGGGGGSCGHGGGGGGGHSSGGGSSSSSSGASSSSGSTTETSSGPPQGCVETTDVEGYRECTHFGAWAQNMVLPHFFIEVGTNVRRYSSMFGGTTGSVTHGDESFAYRVAMPASAPHPEVAVTSTSRLLVGLGHGVYAGLEAEVGGLASAAPLSTEMTTAGAFGNPRLGQQRGMFVGGYGVVGVRGGGSRVALAAELAGGVRTVQITFDSMYHDCHETTTVGATRGLVEARARGELWLSPWVSAGATVGANVAERGDWMAGVYLGFHTRAFGNLR